jgi:hypothetical protein
MAAIKNRTHLAAKRELSALPLGEVTADALPDGAKGITYGQVGADILNQ